jgi:hypothetical protein
MSKHYDNIEYDDKESNIQNTWKKTYSTEESKQEDYDRNNHSISLSEIKEQETLEEAFKKTYLGQRLFFDSNEGKSFEQGAKWQQERSYSEEDLRNAYRWGTTVNHGTKEHFKEWFKQFKKK